MTGKAQHLLESFCKTNDWTHPDWSNYHALFDFVIESSDSGDMISEEVFMMIAKNYYSNEPKIDEFYRQYAMLLKFFNYFKESHHVVVVAPEQQN